MFTSNIVKAASVQISQRHIADGKLRAIIANSGNANACTGWQGMEAASKMASATACELSIKESEVAVASTGVIGVLLPVSVIEDNIGKLKDSLRDDEEGHAAALEAIMTTDTRNKDIAVELEIDGKPVHIGAMTKGSGMIHPNMATMLGFITTDVSIERQALDTALRLAVERSFNRLTVDGDTSTNDMIVIMANGEAGNDFIEGSGTIKDTENYVLFYKALEYVCVNLAKKMARDGEGATKLVTVTVDQADSEEKAVILAKSIASSNLVKAACFGADANWGRVLCAMGYCGAKFNPEIVNVSFASRAGVIKVCENGSSVQFSEETAKQILFEEEIEILVSLQEAFEGGGAKASVWGCDLTYDYVKINGDYRS
jgi:glutamate N-acetyltransferase/amino-acid N-acetyltransferase